jgi:glycosyltransferase involved in cell wall biosynthesis
MNNVKISVITCLYNTEPLLFRKCLESIYNQTFKDFEV